MRSIENCTAAMDYLEGQRNVAGMLKVKISRARKYKDVSCPKEKPQRLSAVFVPCLMTGALCRTISPSIPDMLCGNLVPRLLPSLTPPG